ncbi:MAG: hypothetical protein AB1505_03460 [Candidatus Latescibacterota bacterium]
MAEAVAPPPLRREAMQIPAARLLEALDERLARKREVLAGRDREFGADRCRISSYLENIAWPGLFGFDMNRFYADPEFMAEQELRQRIFWLDNTQGDDLPGLELCPTTGFYWDFTLFGQRIRTAPDGVPHFLPHPLATAADLSLLGCFEFAASGDMPVLLRQHRELRRLSQERYGGRLGVGFPRFQRGPVDLLVQMRGYERFVFDTLERPQFVRAGLARFVAERARWNRARAAWLGEPWDRQSTFIADDWVNPPFLSPALFRDFALPAYRAIQEEEGPITGFHTCGPLVDLVGDLLPAMPGIRTLDVSGWNDLEALDATVDPEIAFHCQMRNTFVLCGTAEEHRRQLDRVRRIAARRRVDLGVQSIVRLHPTYDEDISRMNRFTLLARQVLGG